MKPTKWLSYGEEGFGFWSFVLFCFLKILANKCTGPKTGMCLICLMKSKKANAAGSVDNWMRELVGGSVRSHEAIVRILDFILNQKEKLSEF